MNKTIKILSVLLIAVLVIATMSQAVFASDIIKDFEDEVKKSDVDTSGFTSKLAKIVKAIRNIATVGSVLILSILGFKYMIGSTEERAEYKKSFMPLIVGIIVIVGAASIASALFNVAA